MMGKELEITPNFPDAKLPRKVSRANYTGTRTEKPTQVGKESILR